VNHDSGEHSQVVAGHAGNNEPMINSVTGQPHASSLPHSRHTPTAVLALAGDYMLVNEGSQRGYAAAVLSGLAAARAVEGALQLRAPAGVSKIEQNS